MSNDPLVAVLIPIFGDGGPLRATLDSLLDSRLPARIATLVIDDGSEPPVQADVVRYARLGLHLERLPRHAGIEAALNHGFELARQLGAKYVARLDGADTVHPERLAKQFAQLENHAEVGVVASDVNFVDENGHLLFRFEAPRSDEEARCRMHVNCCLIHASVMLRTSVLAEVGPYSSDYPAAEDYELFFRLLERSRAAFIAEPLTTAVVSPDGISLARRRTQLRSRLRLQWRYFDRARPASYLGLGLTLLFFLVPTAIVSGLKRRIGVSRY